MKGMAGWISLLFIALMAAISFYGAHAVPEGAMLPSHWNIRGEVDGYAPRGVMLVLFPALGVFITAIFLLIPLIDPRKEHIRRSAGLYYASWFGVLGLFTIIHLLIVLSAARGGAPDARLILLPICALLIVIGNFMAKSRSTWFIGLRTPWTLTSETAWIAANRAAGWLFVATGLASGLVAYGVDVETGFAVMGAGAIAAAAIGIAVSYLVWRKDPERLK